MSKPNQINYLGTYITRIENIKLNRAEQYINYLLNGDHDNHIDKTEILNNIGDSRQYVINNKLKIYKNKENKRGKGGKPLQVSDKSLVLAIPKDYDCSESELIDIQMEMIRYIRKIYENHNINVTDDDFYSNIHNQANKHLNFCIPYLDQDGKSIPFIKSNNHFLKPLAKHFTNVVDNTLGTNIRDYMTELDQMAESDKIVDNLADLELSEIQELKEKHKNNKMVKRTLDYVYKVINNVDNNKHIDNLLKTVDKVSKDTKLTKEEYQDLTHALRQGKLLGELTKEGKEKILSLKP